VQCPQCPLCASVKAEPENFSTGQRWGTWFLNTIFPGLGSAVVMGDYAGMGIQMALTGTGIIVLLNWTEEVCYGWSSSGGDFDCGHEKPTAAAAGSFLVLLGASAIFNIFRSYSYNEPISNSPYNHTSNNHNGFNLAVLPNRHGEIMPYLLYNKTF